MQPPLRSPRLAPPGFHLLTRVLGCSIRLHGRRMQPPLLGRVQPSTARKGPQGRSPIRRSLGQRGSKIRLMNEAPFLAVDCPFLIDTAFDCTLQRLATPSGRGIARAMTHHSHITHTCSNKCREHSGPDSRSHIILIIRWLLLDIFRFICGWITVTCMAYTGVSARGDVRLGQGCGVHFPGEKQYRMVKVFTGERERELGEMIPSCLSTFCRGFVGL